MQNLIFRNSFNVGTVFFLQVRFPQHFTPGKRSADLDKVRVIGYSHSFTAAKIEAPHLWYLWNHSQPTGSFFFVIAIVCVWVEGEACLSLVYGGGTWAMECEHAWIRGQPQVAGLTLKLISQRVCGCRLCISDCQAHELPEILPSLCGSSGIKVLPWDSWFDVGSK